MSFLKSVFAAVGVFATSVVVWEGGKWLGRELKKEFDNNPYPEGGKVYRTEHADDVTDDLDTALGDLAAAMQDVDLGATPNPTCEELEDGFRAVFDNLWNHAEEFSEFAIRDALKPGSDYTILGHELAKAYLVTGPSEVNTATLRKFVYEDGSRILAFTTPAAFNMPAVVIVFRTTSGLMFCVVQYSAGDVTILQFDPGEEQSLQVIYREMSIVLDRALTGCSANLFGAGSGQEGLDADFAMCFQLATPIEGTYDSERGNMVFEPDQEVFGEYAVKGMTIAHSLISKQGGQVLVSIEEGLTSMVLCRRTDGCYEGVYVGGVFNYQISPTKVLDGPTLGIVRERLVMIGAMLNLTGGKGYPKADSGTGRQWTVAPADQAR